MGLIDQSIGLIDGWIGYMLSRGLEPRCRSEYLGQLDWSDLRAGWLPPFATPRCRGAQRFMHNPTHSGLLRLDYATQTAHDVSSSTHSGLECEMQLSNTMSSVCGFGLVIRCDVMGWGRGENSRVNQYKSAFVVVQIYEHERNLRRS